MFGVPFVPFNSPCLMKDLHTATKRSRRSGAPQSQDSYWTVAKKSNCLPNSQIMMTITQQHSTVQDRSCMTAKNNCLPNSQIMTAAQKTFEDMKDGGEIFSLGVRIWMVLLDHYLLSHINNATHTTLCSAMGFFCYLTSDTSSAMHSK